MTIKKYIAELNVLPVERFVAFLADIFEYSPWVAEEAATGRPFDNTEALHAAMVQAVKTSTPERRLALIKAHPDLAGRMARLGQLTSESAREQAAAGLTGASPEALRRIEGLNTAYRARFDFPFIICARLNRVETIIEAMERRLLNSEQEEIAAALEEVYKIASLRLHDCIES